MASRTTKVAKDVYRGYMPIDLPQHRPPRKIKPWWKVVGRPRVTLYPKKQIEGYSEVPEYPELNDGSRSGCRTQIRLDWYESLKKLPTVDQKFYEISRHCEHYIAHINNWLPNYNSLPMVQYLTQTNIVQSLPDNYNPTDYPNQELHDKVKRLVLDQIALDKYQSLKKAPFFVSKTVRDGNRSSHVSNRFIQNLVGDLKRVLSLETNPQLLEYQMDLSPAIRSWWYHSGLEPPNNKKFYKSRKDSNGRINQMIQMDGSSAINLRSSSSMEPMISLTDPLVTNTKLVPEQCYPLKHYLANYKYKYPVALPDCLRVMEQKNYKRAGSMDDDENSLVGQAILTAFGWMNSLSMYHGYTPFQELDYPFTCQLVTTDGKYWIFNLYQLNCHTFHRDLAGPKRNNICWTSGKMQLYERYEDGQFEGVNDEVVRLITRFLSQQTSPEYTAQLSLCPFLGEDTRTQDEKDETMKNLRKLLEGRTNKFLSHRRQVPLYEHIFFRSKVNRNRITSMKPVFHIPIPKYPKIFE